MSYLRLIVVALVAFVVILSSAAAAGGGCQKQDTTNQPTHYKTFYCKTDEYGHNHCYSR